MIASLRATLRIARRDAVRARGRSILVIIMIAVPILGVGAADVLYRTFQLTPAQKLTRTLGAADGELDDTGTTKIDQTRPNVSGDTRTAPAPVPLSVLPAGSRVLVFRNAPVRLTHGKVTVEGSATDLAYTDPMTKGIYARSSGRAPRTASEIALTTEYARRLGVGVGGTVTSAGHALTVTGIVVSAQSYHDLTVLQLPGTIVTQDSATALFDVPRALTLADVERANAQGYEITPHRPIPGLLSQDGTSHVGKTTLTFAGLIAGMVVLEIVLLAGPAFAVGVKRRGRDLALVAATGGERRHLRAVVLGGGVVLGSVAGVAGAALGVLLARLALPAFTRQHDVRPGPFEVRPIELLGIVGVGVATALLAAMIPARTAARTDVLAALTGRRGTTRSRKRVPVIGVIATVAGGALALHGAKALNVNLVLAGSILAELGLVATTPFLVGLVGRGGRLLPVGPRFALRDAARNRGRTAPAVSAILAAVAGAIAVSTFVGSLDAHDRRQYQPSGPRGSATVTFFQPPSTATVHGVESALRKELPGATVTVITSLARPGDPNPVQVDALPNPQRACPASQRYTAATAKAQAEDPRCQQPGGFNQLGGPLIGDAATLKAATGVAGAAYTRVLESGGAVVPWALAQDNGTATITVTPSSGKVRRFVVPAVSLPRNAVQAFVMSPAVARRSGAKSGVGGVIALGSTVPSSHDEDLLNADLTNVTGSLNLSIERGYKDSYGIGLLALVLGSAVIVLGASGTATGLAAADGRADLGTLAAVGATPSTRRTLAAFQSAVTAVLGSALGVIAGLVPGIGVVRAVNAAAVKNLDYSGRYPLTLPWRNVLISLLVIPLIAALAAALLTRSRLSVVRRAA